MSIRKGNTLIAGNAAFGYRPPLLQSFWSDHILNRPDLSRADTFSWQSGKMYKAVYKELVSEYDNENSVEEHETTAVSWVQPTITSLTQYGTISGTIGNIINVFDKSTTTYALSQTEGQYIKWEFPEYISVNSVVMKGNWVSGAAAGTDILVYTEINGEEILLSRGTGKSNTSSPYYSTATLSGNIVNNLIFKFETYSTSTAPRIEQININANKTIAFKRTPKSYKIADKSQEQAILDKYNTDGITWIYILDKGNIQFKLPRTKFGFEGVRDSVGSDIPESLPQHSHSFTQFLRTAGGTNNIQVSNDGYEASGSFEVQVSEADNPTYQDNAPVQERSTQMYLYFYVGNYTQSAIEETAGLNAELFNNKADKTEVDGEWIELNEPYDLMRHVSLKGTTYLEFDLSSVIPNDEYKYECLFNGSVTTGSTSGNWGHLALSNINITIDDTELINVTPAYFIGTARTRTSSSATTSGSTTMPLLNDSRKVYVRRNQNFNATGMVQLVAYRRLGKIGV